MEDGDIDVQARWGLGGAVVGAVLVFVAAWLIRGLSWVFGFLVGTFLVGLHGAPSIICSIFGVIFAAILSGGVAILLSAVAVVLIANALTKFFEKIHLAKSGSVGSAVEATVAKAKEPISWFIVLSGVFVVLLESTKELEEDQSSVKLLIYIVLVAIAIFTFCFRRRRVLAYKIVAFVGPGVLLFVCGLLFFRFDAQGHPALSDTAKALGDQVKQLLHEPDKAALFILPMLIGLSSFLSVMEEKA